MNKLIIVLLVFLAACSGVHRISNSDLSWLYRDSHKEKPEYLLYNHAKDSSTIFLKMPVSFVPYQKNKSGEQSADMFLKITVFPSYENKKILDTSSFHFTAPFTDDSTAFILKRFYVRRPADKSFLTLNLYDAQGELLNQSFLNEDNSIQGSNAFLFYEEGKDYPLFSTVLGTTKNISITCNDTNQLLWVRCFFRDYPIAHPPFSNKQPVVFSYNSDSTFQLHNDTSGFYQFRSTGKGIYHLQYDTIQKSGAVLYNFGDDYPLVTDANQMVAALRYVTTASEFERIQQATDKKEAIDQFWIDVSGSRERARFLIKIFYSRMQDANRYFTSYLEGWKTDKGMIYLVFGPPKTVYKTSESEYWDYGVYKGYGNLNFTFKKIENPFTTNDYILVRSAAYEPVWYIAVDQWRQGRIIQTNE
ncbi:MAG TPA: GWxTD domain-containing protein [Bacteroidia bacterium]|nr:GWxTD domain-containing protein [Bacteroidia bacterium]HMU18526.1 GWxTD domain-containing protein [Bacteroidia bacterium]